MYLYVQHTRQNTKAWVIFVYFQNKLYMSRIMYEWFVLRSNWKWIVWKFAGLAISWEIVQFFLQYNLKFLSGKIDFSNNSLVCIWTAPIWGCIKQWFTLKYVYLWISGALCHSELKPKMIKIKLTFSAVMRTTLVNSWTTRSMHFMLGSFNREICFLTMASKAMSGVKRPTLIP